MQMTVMYLGDSENDNPAFRKADTSIGIRSDPKLNPKLDCDYVLSIGFFFKDVIEQGVGLFSRSNCGLILT
jgi:phosphoserine phosphatase